MPEPAPLLIGKVVQVDAAHGFAIIDAGLNPTLATGDRIEAREEPDPNAKITAKLKVSGETLRPFFVADILEGTPSKGDSVTHTPTPDAQR